ncbi:flagellar protein FlgN [Paenibacillus sp. VCA1]|uniref:flagellar protein FlgN n=1 Tax=Paenibacillus sp. VCA1 TaxID=3039148 RepID=UPI0028713E93|nr:flagellar protein FlgN [Paenibacillus sp. VCA1]MDR9853373.1 flagellar protein FlgN [Paenibacillus sp. VCA1]
MSVQQVIVTMDQLNGAYSEMIQAGEEKQQVIIKNDIQALTQIMTRETRLLKQIAEYDAEREEAMQAFLREKGIRSKLQLTITEMTRLVFEPEEKQSLIDAQKRLTETLVALKNINQINKELIDQSLAFIDYSLNLVVSRPEDDMLYKNPAQQKTTGGNNRGFFDARA